MASRCGIIAVIVLLLGCQKESVSPGGYKDFEVVVLNVGQAEVCIFRNDSISQGCDDFDEEHAPSLHYSNMKEGNYLVVGKAGKIKKSERVFYNGGKGSVMLEF